MKRSLTAAAVLMSAAAAPALVLAEPDQPWARKHKSEREWTQERRPWAVRPSTPFGPPPPACAVPTWREGQVLPAPYRAGVVDEPRRYGLYPPPPGHRWVRVGQDVYLADRRGVIREVLRDGI
jgi:Ni/Co efflux regulator RcnB